MTPYPDYTVDFACFDHSPLDAPGLTSINPQGWNETMLQGHLLSTKCAMWVCDDTVPLGVIAEWDPQLPKDISGVIRITSDTFIEVLQGNHVGLWSVDILGKRTLLSGSTCLSLNNVKW